MALTSSEWAAHISVFVIVLSLAFIGVSLTGRVTEGTVNITIVSAASVNFTVANIDWGTGAVNQSQTYAILNTSGTVTQGNWTPVTQGFRLENNGNVNVSLNFSSDKTPSTFLGGTSPTFAYLIQENETSSCVGNAVPSYINFTGSQQAGCGVFPYFDSYDQINVEILLAVPYDASGTKGATITANATAL